MSATKASHPETDFRIKDGGPFSGTWKVFAALGALGLAGAAAGFASDSKRFAYAYLFAFIAFLTPALGALFIVVVQHLTKAGWSVTVRRTAEFFMSGLPVFALLVLPVMASMNTLYPWTHEASAHGPSGEHAGLSVEGTAFATEVHRTPATASADEASGHAGEHEATVEQGEHDAVEHAEHAMHARVLAGKHGYLNTSFFYVRAIFYFLVWAWLATTFFGWSVAQDKSKDLGLTNRCQKLAPIATMLFGVTITFACIDWVMALDPMWYSTIWGVQMFAGSVVCAFALVILTALALRERGLVGNAITVEHFHDLGKLQFGFNVFWAYVTFSQFFLVWYSNVPEETTFYFKRWHEMNESWQGLSWAIFAAHFVLPFAMLLSRNAKRRLSILRVGVTLLALMHFVEMYWIVLPNYGALSVHWMDIACFMGVGGVYLAVVFKRLAAHPLIPVGDPRLPRSIHFEQA